MKNVHSTIASLSLLLAACLSAALSGCMPMKQARVAAVALTVRDVAQAASKQSDLTIVREGTPAFLMLIDGLIESTPDNKDLLIAGCQGYSAYAATFLADEERDKTEPLYRRAKLYGFRALSTGGGDFGKAAAGNSEDFEAYLKRYTKKDAPALLWTANAWAGWIASDPGGVEAMADIPALDALIGRLIELDEGFYYGGPHLLKGVFLAARPAIVGGDLAKAKTHFDRAFALGADKALASRVMFAQYYARGMKDRALYESSLREVLAAPADTDPELTLSNTAAKERAKRLLEKTEEYFEAEK